MPSAEQAFEDLERQRGDREAELRLIEGYHAKAETEQERAILARSLVLLAYAHLEGFTKFALLSYVSVVNSLKVPCSEAAAPLVAATLNRAFVALRDVNAKHDLFRDMPADHDVQIQARHVRFVERYAEVMARVVDVPDDAVETGSNIDGRALRRALFRMGLDPKALDAHYATLNRLLGERNGIAHGSSLNPPTFEAVQTYLSTTFSVMQFIQQEIWTALSDQAYLRQAVNDV